MSVLPFGDVSLASFLVEDKPQLVTILKGKCSWTFEYSCKYINLQSMIMERLLADY